MSLASDILAGSRRALARGLTLVENGADGTRELLAEIYPHTGGAHVVGLTGAPGVGKSTLVDRLARRLADDGHRVGVLAVDPSSPFSGGALLGDRVRMDAASNPDIFVRSIATRGHLGGLSRATGAAIRLLDAFGKDVILLETVGAGQSEVDVMRQARTTIVVLVPGLGDDVQAFKAGILEIGDIFVVNKADRSGADQTMRELRQMLHLGPRRVWEPPIIRAVARDGEGIGEIADAVDRHAAAVAQDPDAAVWRARQAEREIRDALAQLLVQRLQSRRIASGLWSTTVQRVADRQIDPQVAAELLAAEEDNRQ